MSFRLVPKSMTLNDPERRLYSRFRSNLSKNFNFGVLHPCRCTDGVKFGMEEGTFGPLLPAKFHPIGATCRPCGAKNLKIGL